MRKKIVAGNWKMNKNLEEGVKLAREINALMENKKSNAGVIIAPPFIHLYEISRAVDKGKVGLGAQNCSSESSGAYTGEVSADMIRSAGADYVIIGHSERRTCFCEDNSTLLKKVKQTLGHQLTPIFCCGELLNQRQAGHHFQIVKQQMDEVIFNLSAEEFGKIIIAYEPVWAIGTGVNATPQQAQEMHFFIRKLILEKFGETAAENTSILYGGSCKASNAKELFSNPDVDGGLIGGASLQAKEFFDIVHSF